MNHRQRLFVQEYFIDLNATQAAIRAGYSKKTAGEIGYEILKKTEIQEALSEGFRERSERLGKDADWVVERLIENVERAMQSVPVLDSQGEPTGKYVYQGAVANRALELLARHFGVFDRSLKLSDFPKMEKPGDAVVVLGRVIESVASGEITPTQAESFGRLLQSFCVTLEVEELQTMLETILEREKKL